MLLLDSANTLSDGVVTLDGVPAISDVDNLIEIIEVAAVLLSVMAKHLEIDPRGALSDMPMPLVRLTAFVLLNYLR